jgi:hypothetical protein
MKATAAKKSKATKETREALATAQTDYDEALRKSECNAYGRDAGCIKTLKDCCLRRGTRTTKRNNRTVFCCLCKDVEEAERQVNAGLGANRCTPAAE